MDYTKDYIITEYKRLKEYLGKPPSSRIFEKETGIQLKILEKFWERNSWIKLVTECGDTPNNFSTSKVELDEILIQWAILTKNTSQLPAIANWKFNNCKPSINNIKSSHGLRWVDIPYKFLEFYSNNEEWKNIVALIPNRSKNEYLTSKAIPKIECRNAGNNRYAMPLSSHLYKCSCL